MRNVSKLFMVALALSVVLSACGGGGGGSGVAAGGTSTGAFTKTVASANDSAWAAPFWTLSSYSHEQHLVLASDINGSGYIQSLSLRLDDAGVGTSGITCPSLTVKMGNTSLTALTATFADNVQQGRGSLATVRNAASFAIPVTAAGGYFTINLDTPFYYNGVDNLVVEFVESGACSGNISLDAAATAGNYALWVGGTSPTGGLNNEYLNMKFNFSGGNNAILYGGSVANMVPFTNFASNMQKTQLLYPSSGINGSGYISGIGFPAAALTTNQTYVVTIRLGHSTLTDLVATSWDANFNSGSPVTVTSGQTFIVPAGIPANAYIWLPLSNAFNYNGTENLVVEIGVSSATGDTMWRELDTGAVTYTRVYGTIAAPAGRDNSKYDIKFRFNGGTMDVIGTNNSNAAIFGNSVSGRQFLLRAAELGTAGTINKLACRAFATTTGVSYPNFTVTLAHTTQSALVATDATNIAGGTTVYNGTFSMPAGLLVGDWVEIPFSTPFTYNGIDNLVVQTTTGAGSSTQSCQVSTDYATWFAGRFKATGGNSPINERGTFRFWVNK
jgi:hypothetical protein